MNRRIWSKEERPAVVLEMIKGDEPPAAVEALVLVGLLTIVNAEAPSMVSGPGVGGQQLFQRWSGVAPVLLKRSLHDSGDIGKTYSMIEKQAHGYLICGAKHCRMSASRPACIQCQPEAGKSIMVHRLEGKRARLCPIKAR